MSWIQKLYETYENCHSTIGADTVDRQVPLLPICHTTQMAQVEIVIDDNGKFRRAKVVPRDQARTIIPCSEKSAGRTSGRVAHPLCDKLQYVAKDYAHHGGRKKSCFDLYVSQLERWCEQRSNPKAKAVLKYVKRGTVISDLLRSRVLMADKRGNLSGKPARKAIADTLDIFDVVNQQEEAFVRWQVETSGDSESRVWKDRHLWEDWIKYYSSTRQTKTLCYVTGKDEFAADQHPAKLRNDGDKAKLISSNDLSGFTFRGRFLDDANAQKRNQPTNEASGVSFEVTQKAHYALRWLISRQSYRNGDQAIVAWATSGDIVPDPIADAFSLQAFAELGSDKRASVPTAQDLALKLKKKIAGYRANLGDTSEVVVMGLDSATPGRMAISYYRELKGSEFLRRLENWHEACSWIHNYRFTEVQGKDDAKTKRIQSRFVGAPTPSDIAEAAYGIHVDDKLRKATVERILPCIIDGQAISRDLVESVVRRASNRIGIGDWEWEKTLSIACALYRKYRQQENYDMALDLNRKTRDYLYGRLLALADSLEQWALNSANEDRQTNAARLMNRFSEHPFSTWKSIELSLEPYKARLGGKSKKRQRMIDEVVAAFNEDEFLSDKRLSGEFLLGYHCQREYLRHIPEKLADPSGEENNDSVIN